MSEYIKKFFLVSALLLCVVALMGCGKSSTEPDPLVVPHPSPSVSPTPAPVSDCDVIALALSAKVVGEKGGGVYRWRADQDARIEAISLYQGTGNPDFDSSTCPQNIGPYSWDWQPHEICVAYGDKYSSSVVLHCVRPVFELCVDVSVASNISGTDLARGRSCYQVVPGI